MTTYAGQYTDPETGYQYLRARYYDPGTGVFLTRDPIAQLTQEPYGYVGGNPLNATDPMGLSKCGELSLGGFIDCASKTDDAVEEAVGTGGMILEATLGYAFVEGTEWLVNGFNEHIGLSGTVCLYLCVGLEVQNGGAYLNYGHGWAVGATFGANWYSHSLDDRCPDGSDGFGGVGPVSLSADGGNDDNVSVGYGPGYLLGGAKMRSKQFI